MTQRTALLVIDVQQSIIDNETPNPGPLLDRIEALVASARAAGAPVVWITDTRVGPDPSLHARLSPRQEDVRVTKDYCDAFLGTTLRQDLARLGVRRLVVCGLQTDFCIDTSCRAAAALGFAVTLVGDAHSTFDRPGLTAAMVVAHHNMILADFPAGEGSVAVATSGEVRFG